MSEENADLDREKDAIKKDEPTESLHTTDSQKPQSEKGPNLENIPYIDESSREASPVHEKNSVPAAAVYKHPHAKDPQDVALSSGQIKPSVSPPGGSPKQNQIHPTRQPNGPEAAKDCVDGHVVGKERHSIKREGVDEVDRASIFSFYMETDFRFFFQHPVARLFIAYLVTFCNFLIYAEDPVAHSEKECYIPIVGNCFSFVCMQYAPNGWTVLKVCLWLVAILCGFVVGKLIMHKLFFNGLLKLKMFLDDQGSWVVMFFTTILFLFTFSWIYNAFLLIGGDFTKSYWISDMMGLKNSTFMKAAACGTWCGDLFTAWMVTDVMLQDKLYPNWAKPLRAWWNRGYNRIILFWITVLVTSVFVITVIATNVISWDTLNRDFLPTNEVSRSFLASFILVMDLLIVMQDWDFPHFINNFDIKLPGLNTADLKFTIPKCMRKEEWTIHITGKWFNYGIIFIVMLLDLNMWKNQIFYSPYDYGQYTDPEGKVHTVLSQATLATHNKTTLNYAWRSNNTNPATNQTYIMGDMVMHSRYYDYHLGITGMAFVPSIVAFLCFGILIWYFGRWKPTEDDPHGGRLKKRKKRRLSRSSLRASIRGRKMKVFKDSGASVTYTGDGKITDKDKKSFPENWQP